MAEKIKILRKEKGLTQAELSEISHVPRICIARYEAGEHKPGMGNAQKLRQMDIDFGIIPGPKWDEAPENYANCGGNPYFMCVLTTNADLERTGILMESMAYESMKTVKVAAYDEMLMGKVSRDNDSEAMLDIINSTLVYDHPIAATYLNTQITDNYMFKGKNDYASFFTKFESKITKEIQKYIDAYDEILD